MSMYKIGDKVVMVPGTVWPSHYYDYLIPNEIYTIKECNTPNSYRLSGCMLDIRGTKNYRTNSFNLVEFQHAKSYILKQILMEEDNEKI